VSGRAGRAAAAGAAAGLALAALGGGDAHSASLVLAERDRQEALRVGERSVASEVFGDEWRVTSATGESVVVFTPFHRLALAARQAAFKDEALKPGDQDKALAEAKDRLMLWVHLRGARIDFAQHLRPRLVSGDREVAPSRVQNERTAAPQADGRFMARCVYWFPTKTKDLTGAMRLELVVRDADDRPVARFPIDLARMR
jgi:hypothetical protein